MYGVPITHLSLEEYWEWLQVPEVFGYGIRNHPDYVEGKGCGDFWDQTDRYFLAGAIAKAEKRMRKDRWLGFPIRREYNDGISRAREMEWKWPLYLGKYVRGIGVEAESVIEAGVDLSVQILAKDDPVEFTVTVNFTDVDELLIYYPGQTKYTIRPSSISISGTTATLQIPRARLLKPAYFVNYENVSERPDYTNDTYFLTAVDAYRNYLNTATGSNLVWNRRLTDTFNCCLSNVTVCDPGDPCGQTLQLACGAVTDQRNGIVQLEPATYSSGVWSKASYAVCRRPDMVQINYMRGYFDRYDELDEDLIRAIIAVAHNNFPEDPCFRCALQQQYYERDVKPIEPAVNMGLGPSTWGIHEATNIIREFDANRNSHHGGML